MRRALTSALVGFTRVTSCRAPVSRSSTSTCLFKVDVVRNLVVFEHNRPFQLRSQLMQMLTVVSRRRTSVQEISQDPRIRFGNDN